MGGQLAAKPMAGGSLVPPSCTCSQFGPAELLPSARAAVEGRIALACCWVLAQLRS